MMTNGKPFGSKLRSIFSRKKSEQFDPVEPSDNLRFEAASTAADVRNDETPPEHENSLALLSPAEPLLPATLGVSAPVEPVDTSTIRWRDRLPNFRKSKTEGSASGDKVEPLTQRPIRLFMGYVPDVTEKDARFFAMGVAEKNVESEYISYLGVFRYGTGYAYEIQEGGHGHSYLTKIIKHFNQLPPNLHDAETAVYVATASRMVQIEKTADGGLVCIQLPELYKVQETDWVKPEKKLKLLRDQNSGIMMVAGTYLGISLLVLAGAFLTRYVPRESPAGRVWYDTVSLRELPISQWGSMIQETNSGHYILSLRYNGKQWCRKTELTETCGDKPAPLPAAVKPGDSPAPAPTNPASMPGATVSASPPGTANAASAAPPSAVVVGGASSAAAPHLPPLPPVPNK